MVNYTDIQGQLLRSDSVDDYTLMGNDKDLSEEESDNDIEDCQPTAEGSTSEWTYAC